MLQLNRIQYYIPMIDRDEGTSMGMQYDTDGSAREWGVLRFVKMIWSWLSNLRHLWLISFFLFFYIEY